ncbi:Transcriptional regulators-like protein OS=Pirellula staleyi (strain ATCC 27377 / DSM 6068 / ICPB 4128) GN=Psta_4678 PE=4 SV=1: Peripla_BP_3 [Gemmataceae bacterium]|nr:Transcriptional regulators-like protein OS=Pirellula staleyi (strain ATCC 27377 / DSM 6068 / ICPB 4128) GN=Psta_4678 PE=4 SV=1: Peripla_BP_3 [Gemmataceae bacterium]VTU02573.1 Transcriptional regulators-like protein OS=Pirellula staleyi (strain ATCC 27377 / DSM 6068 / ICPB 4128) GN=Psta_4678 PE=4 SV=1: Peripla_BP_3 [Gemmataceae bacterium]
MTSGGTAPVYAQIAESLRPRLAGWAESGWPTVRVVANEFKVSVVTASRALQALKDHAREPEGEAEPGGGGADPQRWAVCLHVSPGPYQHAAYQVTAAGFRDLAHKSGCGIDLDTVRLGDEPDAPTIRGRVRAARDAGAGGLFLLPSRVSDAAAGRDEELLAAAAAEGLPVVLVERNLRGATRPLTHDLVCFHDFGGGAALARHLIDLGRKRIAFVAASDTCSHVERLGGYLAAVVGTGLPPLVVHQPEGATPRQAYTAVADQLVAAGADAAICYHDHAAVGVVMELLRRGVPVPTGVAVAGFYNMPIGESFSIGLTTYAFPAATVAERAVDLMRLRLANPAAPPVKLVVPGALVVRDSTDPAALA